jgi:polyferredoxin
MKKIKDIFKKDKKKAFKKKLKKIFKKENLVKIIIIFATLALVLTSILPYLFL